MPAPLATPLAVRPRESGDPARTRYWIPAFAGMNGVCGPSLTRPVAREGGYWRMRGSAWRSRLLALHRPVAVLDLQHAERREIEAEMVGRRHVHQAAGAHEVLGLLECVAHLGLVGALGARHGVDQQHQAVIGVTAEGRDRLAGLGL